MSFIRGLIVFSKIGVLIEFTELIFRLFENDSVSICIRLLEGELERNVTVTFQLSSDEGKLS